MTAKTYATWHASLTCTCPSCKEYVNLMECKDFWDGRTVEIGEQGTDRTINFEAVCPKCDHEFKVDLQY